MEGFKVFGQDIEDLNEHWLKTYSWVLNVLSSTKDIDFVQFIHLKGSDDEGHSINAINDFLESKGYYTEGYTLKVVTEWLISYAKYITAKNKALEIDSKKKKLSEMKAEIEKLENEIEKLE